MYNHCYHNARPSHRQEAAGSKGDNIMPDGLYTPNDPQPPKLATEQNIVSLRLEVRASLKDIWEVVQLLEREQEELHKKFDMLMAVLAGDA
jgi:hypothetical protein